MVQDLCRLGHVTGLGAKINELNTVIRTNFQGQKVALIRAQEQSCTGQNKGEQQHQWHCQFFQIEHPEFAHDAIVTVY
jgi:hypothetical protein